MQDPDLQNELFPAEGDPAPILSADLVRGIYLEWLLALQNVQYESPLFACSACRAKRTGMNPCNKENCSACPVRGVTHGLPVGRDLFDTTSGKATPTGDALSVLPTVLQVIGERMTLLETHLPSALYTTLVEAVLPLSPVC